MYIHTCSFHCVQNTFLFDYFLFLYANNTPQRNLKNVRTRIFIQDGRKDCDKNVHMKQYIHTRTYVIHIIIIQNKNKEQKTKQIPKLRIKNRHTNTCHIPNGFSNVRPTSYNTRVHIVNQAIIPMEILEMHLKCLLIFKFNSLLVECMKRNVFLLVLINYPKSNLTTALFYLIV